MRVTRRLSVRSPAATRAIGDPVEMNTVTRRGWPALRKRTRAIVGLTVVQSPIGVESAWPLVPIAWTPRPASSGFCANASMALLDTGAACRAET